MEFSRPEYWSGTPFPSPGDLPNPGIEPRSPPLQADSLPAEPQGKSKNSRVGSLSLLQWIFPTQESNRGLLHCRQILHQLSYEGSSAQLNNSKFYEDTDIISPRTFAHPGTLPHILTSPRMPSQTLACPHMPSDTLIQICMPTQAFARSCTKWHTIARPRTNLHALACLLMKLHTLAHP